MNDSSYRVLIPVRLVIKLLDYMGAFLFKLSEIGIVAITIVVLFGVFMRYALNMPLHWSNDISGYLFVFTCFIGGQQLTKNRTQIRADYFVMNIKGQALRVLNIFINSVSLFWGLLISNESWKLVFHAYRFEELSSTLMRFPMFITYSFLAVGVTFISLQLMVEIFKDILGSKYNKLIGGGS
jgi:TRAP-type C4-dicarboxylate transport system permease small subunit